jgi:D-sedoheptulose 7-phosphate isomerase
MISDYMNEMSWAISEIDADKILKMVEVLQTAKSKNKRIYTFGNGGSGSTASHFAGDLSKSCGIRAFCLNDSIPSLTAWANDSDYRVVFERQLFLIDKGDVIFAISGSGNSQNIVRALKAAKEKGIYTIGLTAFDGGLVKELSNLSLVLPTKNMEVAEDLSLMVCHILKAALVTK